MANFNTEVSFWEEFSGLKTMEPFADFMSKDKSKDKSGSSKVMWAIALAELHDSDWYNLPDKYNKLQSDFLKKKDHNWLDYEALIAQFKATQLTQAERSLSAWNEMMAKRDKYLKAQDYYFDQYAVDDNGDNIVSKTGRNIEVKGTAEQLDKAYGTTPKMYADYEKIKKSLEQEHAIATTNKGSVSLSDQGLI